MILLLQLLYRAIDQAFAAVVMHLIFALAEDNTRFFRIVGMVFLGGLAIVGIPAIAVWIGCFTLLILTRRSRPE